jgi:hypothetical protein
VTAIAKHAYKVAFTGAIRKRRKDHGGSPSVAHRIVTGASQSSGVEGITLSVRY